jgi:hypothetical protein
VTAEQRPGVFVLEEGERGGARQLSHHDRSAEVERRAPNSPLDPENPALGVSGWQEIEGKKGSVKHGRGHGIRRLVRRNTSVAVDVHVQDRPMPLFKFRQIAQLLVSVAGCLRGDCAPREGVSRLHAA